MKNSELNIRQTMFLTLKTGLCYDIHNDVYLFLRTAETGTVRGASNGHGTMSEVDGDPLE